MKIDAESNSPFINPDTKPIYESIPSKEKDECRLFENYYEKKEGKPFPKVGRSARKDLEIKCGNAKYRHMKYPNMFPDIPSECKIIED